MGMGSDRLVEMGWDGMGWDGTAREVTDGLKFDGIG